MAKSRSSFIWKPIDFKYTITHPRITRTNSYPFISSINRVRRNITKPVTLQVAEKLTEKVLDKLSTNPTLVVAVRGTNKHITIQHNIKNKLYNITITNSNTNSTLYTISVTDHTTTIPYTTSILIQTILYSIKSVVDEVPNLL